MIIPNEPKSSVFVCFFYISVFGFCIVTRMITMRLFASPQMISIDLQKNTDVHKMCIIYSEQAK